MRRFSARLVVCVGASANALAYAGIALVHGETWQIAAWMVVQGIGNGCVVSSLAGVVLNSVSPFQTGMASGMNANIRLIGGSIGSAVMAGIVTARLDGAGYPLEVGYRDGFLVLALGAVAAAGLALLIPRTAGRVPAPVTEAGAARETAARAQSALP